MPDNIITRHISPYHAVQGTPEELQALAASRPAGPVVNASAAQHDAGQYSAPFDTVKIAVSGGSTATLFLPTGTGQSVADAINKAIKGDAE